MKKIKYLLIFFSLFIVLFGCSINVANNNFIRRNGNKLIVGKDGQVIWLRGINFTNYYWEDYSTENINENNHHSKIDFQRVSNMGMNVIRFCLSYKIFEDNDSPYEYKKDGWDWLDKNINWAKEYGIYLIFDMHIPQGGDWLDSTTENDFSLWTEEEPKKRLKALWKAIAIRYKNETIIAAYNILNEPLTGGPASQWNELAQEIINEIRLIDKNHLIIVEKVYGQNQEWSVPDDITQFLVNDNNIMYDFHFYLPFEYTHQYADWVEGLGDGGKYPDPSILEFPENMEWVDNIPNNPEVPIGDSDWNYYEGELYQVTNTEILAGEPIFSCSNNTGTVYFDNFVVKEYDENQQFVRDITTFDITSEEGWYPWSSDESGVFELSTLEGYSDSTSLSISDVTDIGVWSNPSLRFEAIQNYHYQISGYMKGLNVSSGAICNMNIDFLSDPSGIGILHRDKDYLEAQLLKWCEFGINNKVPINIGEFGVIRYCYENDKGGLNWVNDMLDLLISHELHFTYWDYHSSNFGLYYSTEGLPSSDCADEELINLFTQVLK